MNSKRKKVLVSFDPAVLKRLDAKAKKNSRDRSTEVNRRLSDSLRQDRQKAAA